jgi:hypothetical protein
MRDFDSDVHQVGAGQQEANIDDLADELKVHRPRVLVVHGCALIDCAQRRGRFFLQFTVRPVLISVSDVNLKSFELVSPGIL